ncbi:MAG: DNA polymerase I [Clostridiales bacterium]|nr:DNA polymerase I [Clostridiales bacterium]
MKKLILIDGNSLLFRAYFAMRPMVTSKGMHTQGVFAFVNMLNKIISDYEPSHIAVAFDMKGGTFRHDVYKEYKAGRLKTPPELLSQIPMMHEVLEAMNIAVIEIPQFEADDIIGTIASRAESDSLDTLVISGDKDELQLVGPHVNVLINKRGMSEFDLYDIEAMKERYGLTPKQFIDLKGLMGDSSDNIPGVPGIGEKKGIALLEQFGSLENLIEHADEVKGKMGENLRDNIEVARMSKWLATINTESPVEFEWSDLEYRAPDMEKLIAVYTELEFSSFIRKLQADSAGETEAASAGTVDLSSGFDSIKRVSFEKFLSEVKDGSEVYIEASTDASHLEEPKTGHICLYSDEKGIACIKESSPMEYTFTAEEIGRRSYRLCGCGLKRVIYSLISGSDVDLRPFYDVQIAEYLIDANRQKYPLDKLLLRYAGYVADPSETAMLSDDVSYDSLALDPGSLLKRAYYSAKVRPEQEKLLEENGLRTLFDDCEMPLVLTLARMELAGIKCDPSILKQTGEELRESIEVLEKAIYAEAGTEFNINSPKQLGTILFERMGIPYPKGGKNKSGSYSTAADILDKLKDDNRIVSDVLAYRKVAKLNSTYVEGLLPLIGEDGRVRPHFMQTVAATGRLSCTEPNLQNIPIRDEYGRLIRKAFIAPEGCVFTGSDYSQIELRVLAALSGDESLIADFKAGKDIHRATASRVFGIPEDEVTALDRTRAKAVNFGVVYGMSGFGLGESLSISRSEGQKYINEYFAKHTAVKDYLDEQIKTGEETREVRTYFGRIRKIPEFASRKFMERELAKRLAMNTPIQGTAADIIKIAMNSVSRELRERGLQSRLILQIHDELIVEGPETEAEEVRKILTDCMMGAADLAVDLVCDIHTGSTWYDLK